MTEKDILLSFASKIFAKTDEELAALLYQKSDEGETLKADAFDQLVNLDTSRITRIKKATNTDLFDNGHKKGTKEAMEEFEKRFKENTGHQSDSTGMDLILEWGETLKTGITEDKLKTHPTFLSAEKNWKDKYDRDLGQIKTEFESFKTAVAREQKFAGIRQKGEEIFMGLRPVLSEDPVKAKRQVNNFLDSLKSFDFMEQEGQMIISRDGHRIEDEHSNPVSFDRFVKDNAELIFDFHQQDQKANAGNKNVFVTVPKTEAEYNTAIQNESDPAKRIKLQDEFYRSQGKPLPKIS